MTSSFGVETRRLASRRLFRWATLLLFAGLLSVPFLLPFAYREQSRITFDADVERCVQAREPRVRDGIPRPTIPPDVAAPAERERLCEQVTPRVNPEFHLLQLSEVLRTTAPLLVIAGFLVGASSIGADWQAGVVALVLTWEGRRWRVVIARLAALVLAVVAAAAVWQALLGSLAALRASVDGTTSGAGADWLWSEAGQAARISTLAGAASAFGFALALVGRGTAVALGAGFAYLFVFENVAGSQFKPLRPWLAIWNAIVFVKGTFAAGGDVPHRSVAEAAVILAIYTIAVAAGAGVVFARRDVT